MQRVAFVLKVKSEMLEEYKRRHRAVWRPDGLLFGYLETPDFDRAREEMAKREVNARWQREMAPFFESLSGRPDEAMMPLEEVFHLD
jgi:L-rhamnose mutarotase